MIDKESSDRFHAALVYATAKHEGQTRIGGDPYITHPMAVARLLQKKGYDTDYQIAGLFHDLLEDTDATEDDILRLGGNRVLHAVQLLTKRKGYIMAEYMAGIRSDPMACAVKAADRLHNLRCAEVCSAAFRKKYIRETNEWYLDLDPEIPEAVHMLEANLSDTE